MAQSLLEIFPTPELLLQLPVQDLAPVVLKVARDARGGSDLVHVQAVLQQMHGAIHDSAAGYRQDSRRRSVAVSTRLGNGPSETVSWYWSRETAAGMGGIA
jgi:hypothetical protein